MDHGDALRICYPIAEDRLQPIDDTRNISFVRHVPRDGREDTHSFRKIDLVRNCRVGDRGIKFCAWSQGGFELSGDVAQASL